MIKSQYVHIKEFQRLTKKKQQTAISEIIKSVRQDDSTLTRISGICFTSRRGNNLQALTEALQLNTHVTELNLSFCPLSDTDIQLISECLQVNNHLLIVKLNAVGITPTGARHLAKAIRRNKALQILELQGNTIGNRGCRAIAKSLRRNNTLRKLNLNNNQLTDSGLSMISKVLSHNIPLKKLYLDQNKFTVVGIHQMVEALKSNIHLHHLAIQTVDMGLPANTQVEADSDKEIVQGLLACAMLERLDKVLTRQSNIIRAHRDTLDQLSVVPPLRKHDPDKPGREWTTGDTDYKFYNPEVKVDKKHRKQKPKKSSEIGPLTQADIDTDRLVFPGGPAFQQGLESYDSDSEGEDTSPSKHHLPDDVQTLHRQLVSDQLEAIKQDKHMLLLISGVNLIHYIPECPTERDVTREYTRLNSHLARLQPRPETLEMQPWNTWGPPPTSRAVIIELYRERLGWLTNWSPKDASEREFPPPHLLVRASKQRLNCGGQSWQRHYLDSLHWKSVVKIRNNDYDSSIQMMSWRDMGRDRDLSKLMKMDIAEAEDVFSANIDVLMSCTEEFQRRRTDTSDRH